MELNNHEEKNRRRREKWANNTELREKHKKECRERYLKNRERYLAKCKQYVENNKEKVKCYKKAYYFNNHTSILNKAKEYRQENRQAINAWRRDNRDICNASANTYQKKRRAEDSLFKLSGNIRTLLGRAFRRGSYGKKSKTQEILGCDFSFLENHLILSAINNYGVWVSSEEYEIDHILPLSSAKTEEDIIKLNHYSNLQYLTPLDNQKKYNKMDFTLNGG